MDELTEKGSRRLKWAFDHMPVLRELDRQFREERPLEGLKVGMALHTEAKTGMLAVTLANAGAQVRLASCNPLSTDDSVVAALREEYGLEVFAKKWETDEEYYANLNAVLDMRPDYVIDDGADLITMAHTSRRDALGNIKGGNEETTTGIVRLKAMAAEGRLEFPVIDVNDAKMKHLFDNRYGTGQSAFDGWMTATNLVVAGKHLVVAGYGWCGRGVAMRAKGLGAIVTVTEIDPVKAIEARMDGFDVMRMEDAVRNADIVMTVTGCKDVVSAKDFKNMKDGCVMGNVGHFDNEISKRDLDAMSVSRRRVREFVDEYAFADGRRVYLIGEGRLMNLAAGQGHPAEIMDTSFSAQALGIVYMARHHGEIGNVVFQVPDEIDDRIARIELAALGGAVDELTPEQRVYIHSWQEGTRLRVLIMTDSYLPTRDGVVTSVIEQRKILAEMGHEVVVMAPDPGPKHREEGVVYLPAKPFKTYPGYFVPKILRRSKRLVEEIAPDVIHVRGVAVMALKALMASHSLHIPTVLTYDTMVTDVIDRYSPIKMKKERLAKLASIYLRQALKRPNCIIAPSDDTARELTEGVGVRPKRLVRIPTPVETSRFHRVPGGGVRAEFGLEGRRVVISVGRASFEKNTDLVIRSLRLMPDDVFLLVVGDGPALEGWKATAEECGMSGRVVFAGFVENPLLPAYYSAADAFVSASVFETQGITAVEAMACGLPVACGNGRAFRDYIRDGENGYLFDLTEEACAGAMSKALDAPDPVRAATAATVGEFSPDAVGRKLVETYEAVVAARRGSA